MNLAEASNVAKKDVRKSMDKMDKRFCAGKHSHREENERNK